MEEEYLNGDENGGMPAPVGGTPGNGASNEQSLFRRVNNGSRADRFEAKKFRKELLKSVDLEALTKGDLFAFSPEGKIKIKSASQFIIPTTENTEEKPEKDEDNGELSDFGQGGPR